MSELINFQQFSNAFINNGYEAPNESAFDIMIKNLKVGGIETLDELAMFIAQVIHKSEGLKNRIEWNSQQLETRNCPDSYQTPGVDVPGQYYFGRGYLQLTWAENYIACSKALYGDERLLSSPSLVSDTEEGCWFSALWYWNWRVHRKWDQGFQAMTMDTDVILEDKELEGPNSDKAILRYSKYQQVCKAFGIKTRGIAEPVFSQVNR